MGGDIINMVETMMFMGIVILACVTVLAVGMTILMVLMGWDLAISLWSKIRY
jgi:hypothetical protein